MTPYYQDEWLQMWGGDCREVLRGLPGESVHCVVTSPPYWGLRDYGIAPSTWGGDPEHEHEWAAEALATEIGRGNWAQGVNGRGEVQPGGVDAKREPIRAVATRGHCVCGAWLGTLGLEPTPEQYVENMVAVFREVRRVLRADGTLWLNLGSSYAAGDSGSSPSRRRRSAPAYGRDGTAPLGSPATGFAYPDLCDGCRAVQSSRTADSDRPSPEGALLPETTTRDSEHQGFESVVAVATPPGVRESTTLRSSPPLPADCRHCANCGACLSVLGSFERDARACARRSGDTGGTTRTEQPSDDHSADTEPSASAWGHYASTLKPKDMVPIPWMVAMALQADGWYLRSDIIWSKPNPMPESVTDRPTKSHEYLFLLSKSPRYYFDADAVRERQVSDHLSGNGFKRDARLTYRDANGARGNEEQWQPSEAGRNIRSVWTIATQPYPGAHFAVFPPKLVEPCIKAGTSERGVCPECGAPWRRVVERTAVQPLDYNGKHSAADPQAAGRRMLANVRARREAGEPHDNPFPSSQTTGWQPSCAHDAEPAPATCLDPFAGSGTVGKVAQALSRRAVLIDLNPDYLKQQLERNRDLPLGLVG